MVCSVPEIPLVWYIVGAKEPVMRDGCDNNLHHINVDYVLFLVM